MKIITFLFIAAALMTARTEAGQTGPLKQLSQADPAAGLVPAPEPGTPRSDGSLSIIRTTHPQQWERVECYQDTVHPFAMESMLNKSRHDNADIVAAFGSNMPQSSTFLLHYGPKWKTNTGKVVVLAHGASDNATRAWAAPASLIGDPSAPGLLQALEAKGFRVFAVTFPHKHGNLFYEAQYLADAIAIAKQATGVEKVVLIGHSAGGLAARAYVSSYRLNNNWTAYRGDVGQFITLATPHRGQDFAFRHPEFNYFFMQDTLTANAPMSWDKILAYGIWKDTFDFSIYSDNFPMQQQVLSDWTGKYPMSPLSPDSYTTMHGGQGLVSHSLGIESAMLKGGNFMSAFKGYPVPAEIPVTVIAGTKQDIKDIPQTEKDGPSDGLVFLESASHTADLTAAGRKEPIQKILVNENHLTITYSPDMLKLVPDLIK